MAIEYPDDNTAMIPELRPDRDLINIRKTFGIDPQFLLSDKNQYYTNINDDMPIEKIDEGIASIDTGLPIYTQDGDGSNNFLQYSNEGAPGYIRPIEIAAPMNQKYKLQDPTVMKMANFDELFGPKTFTDSLGNVRTVPGEKRFTLPKEKTGILQSIKDGGSKLLDFIKGGGITGNLIGGLLPEQSPEAIFIRDYYGGEDGSNLTSTGSIASGLMAGYNPISGGFLNTISGGKFGQPTTYGLQNAYDRRIATIRKTLARKYGDPNYKGDKTKLDEILEKLIKEKAKEKAAIEKTLDISGKQAAQNFMNQNPNYGNPEANENPGSGGGSGYDPGADYSGSDKRSEDNRSSDLGFSDIRLKENVELIGKSPSNINIYKFNYKDNPTTYQGAMAHEVPWASVKHSNGYMMIDYNQIDVEFKKWQK
jgi:hypothetical protein